MTKIIWDALAERKYETGVSKGVLYIPTAGRYDNGVAWNGLTAVNETPSGAEPNPWYADNMKYINILSIEEFGGTIEAMYYPDEFIPFDGGKVVSGGITVSQQGRPQFGFSYQNIVGNAVDESNFGYKIHLVYGAQASPSERPHATVNESPENSALSWDFTTTAVEVTGMKPTAHIIIDSTKVSRANLTALETILYGTAAVNPRLPFPDEVLALFAGSATAVVPGTPTYTSGTRTIAIPTTANVTYWINGEQVTGNVVVPANKTYVVKARPNSGYYFADGTDDDFSFGS